VGEDVIGQIVHRSEAEGVPWSLAQDAADELIVLRSRIRRAIAALDAAPDPASDEASKREAHRIQSANLIARTILAEGTEPPQRRGG
jgi:hypothetical protein